ncbi:MAG: acetyltransferase [Flavobacterium sp.]
MLIVGAKGFAKEILEICYQLQQLDDLVFYDDVNADAPNFLYQKFSVLKNKEAAAHYFKTVDSAFTIGIGNPFLRKKIADQFEQLGGVFTSTISPLAKIGHYENSIGNGCNIMTGTILTNDITVGKGVLINLNCTVGHDSILGDFVEMSPGVHLSGNCTVGAYSNIGSNATILPKVNIGENVIVGAGSVVTKDVPDNCLVVGVPAIIKKELPKLVF